MNKELWTPFHEEKTDRILKERGYDVKRTSDGDEYNWVVLDKDGQVLAQEVTYTPEPGFKDGQFERYKAIHHALGVEANQSLYYDRLVSKDFTEISKKIAKLEDLLMKSRSNKEFDEILSKTLTKAINDNTFDESTMNLEYKDGDTLEDLKKKLYIYKKHYHQTKLMIIFISSAYNQENILTITLSNKTCKTTSLLISP